VSDQDDKIRWLREPPEVGIGERNRAMVEQKAGQEEIRSKSDCYMLWCMTRLCNFNCTYCFRKWEDVDPVYGKYSAERIAQRFGETGKVWHIRMTGGEPLLYPGFVEFVKALTRRHYIPVITNLLAPNAYELTETIESQRVHSIGASLHIEGQVREFS